MGEKGTWGTEGQETTYTGRGLCQLSMYAQCPRLTSLLTILAGQVSAILGPSGAGKSTLLQLLAQRPLNAAPLSRFSQSGSLSFGGQPISSTSRSNVSFVEQDDDWHLPSLTVRETLRYAAILRLPDKMPKRDKIARAETVLRMLGLKDCADLPVGGALLKGISGGEKRRLSLAVQSELAAWRALAVRLMVHPVINDPAVLLVDEPYVIPYMSCELRLMLSRTSGLDSSIAWSVMQVLRDIAATGRTVIGEQVVQSDLYGTLIPSSDHPPAEK